MNYSECARSSKRTARLISGIALDECRAPERYRTRAPLVPIAQTTEQARPKRQVAGENPAGDTTAPLAQKQSPRLMTGRRWRDTSTEYQFSAPKAFAAMPSPGTRASPVQLRVGAPFRFCGRSRASAQVPFCPGSIGDCAHPCLHAAACGFLL